MSEHRWRNRWKEYSERSEAKTRERLRRRIAGEAPAAKVAEQLLRHVRRVIILIVGGTVVLAGLALTVLPGPAFVVIPLGLGILSIEFAWARRLLRTARDLIRNTVTKGDTQQTTGRGD